MTHSNNSSIPTEEQIVHKARVLLARKHCSPRAAAMGAVNLLYGYTTKSAPSPEAHTAQYVRITELLTSIEGDHKE